MSNFRRVLRRSSNAADTQNFTEFDEVTRQLDINPFMNGEYHEVKVRKGDKIIVPHGLGRKYRGFFCTTHGGLMVDRTVGDKHRKIVLRCQSPFNFVEEKVVTSAASTVTFENLDGDEDERYYLESYWASTGTNQALAMRPNGVTSGWQTAWATVENGTYTDGQATDERIGFTTGANNFQFGQCQIHAKTGEDRYTIWHEAGRDSTDTDEMMRWGMGWWNEASTKITSIQLAATNIAAGSTFRLFKRGLGGETVGIWVF